MSEILDGREERSFLIKKSFRGFPLLVIKANTPGPEKKPPWAHFLVDYFRNLVSEIFQAIQEEFYENADGFFWIIEIQKSENIKEKLIEIEEKHPLGRLIDLDLFLSDESSISRKKLNLPLRNCLLCQEPAIVCIRNKAHSLFDLSNRIKEIILDFLCDNIYILLDEAITLEAKVHPKFGLVTKKSSGSHPDMNFALMMEAKKAIIPPFIEIFKTAYSKGFETAYQEARRIGLEAEKAMYQSTGGVNAYKGLIFVLGLVLVSLGNSFQEYRFDLFSKIKKLGRELNKDFLDQKLETGGLIAYRKYGITGIRGEVMKGLPNVRKVLPRLNDFSRKNILMSLIDLIRDVEDTVLLKRAGSLEKYQYYRNLIGNIKTFDEAKIYEITAECIENNLSFGGSADLLIVTIFLKKVEGCLKLNYESNLSDRSL
jgi:holo-ACP synthase CitX